MYEITKEEIINKLLKLEYDLKLEFARAELRVAPRNTKNIEEYFDKLEAQPDYIKAIERWGVIYDLMLELEIDPLPNPIAVETFCKLNEIKPLPEL